MIFFSKNGEKVISSDRGVISSTYYWMCQDPKLFLPLLGIGLLAIVACRGKKMAISAKISEITYKFEIEFFPKEAKEEEIQNTES